MVSASDKTFLKRMMRHFGIKKLGLDYSPSPKRWPDIWLTQGKVPVITVTREWARQNASERRKRLLHEVSHLLGLEHGKYGRLVYSTYPAKDSFSRELYRRLSNPIVSISASRHKAEAIYQSLQDKGLYPVSIEAVDGVWVVKTGGRR